MAGSGGDESAHPRELHRVRGLLALALGLGTAASGAVSRVWPPAAEAFMPEAGLLPVASAGGLVVAALLAAVLTRPRRDAAVVLGAVPLAALAAIVLGIAAVLVPDARAALAAASLEAGGGVAVVTALLRLAEAKQLRAFPDERPNRKRKVRVRRRDQKRPAEVALDGLHAGDEVELGPGDDIPADGTVLSGSGFVDESSLLGTVLPQAKRPGDPVFAGTHSSIPDLVMRVGAPVASSLIVQREELAGAVADELRGAGASGKLAAFGALLVSAFAGALLVASHGLAAIGDWLPGLTALLLAVVSGAPVHALISGRLAVLRAARSTGIIVARARDLWSLAGVRRWQIDPRVLAAPGEVEVIPVADEPSELLLGVAEALIAVDVGPELVSIAATARTRKIRPLAAAALRRTQSVYHGTVEGRRWFLGPERAVRDEEWVGRGDALEPALDFMRSKGLIPWLVGRPDEGIVGVLGVGIEVEPEAKATAVRLRATVMPGLPDGTRRAVATAAGIPVDGPPLIRRDGTLLAEGSPPPSSGLRLRVLRPRPGVEIRAERASRLLAPSLSTFADAASGARAILWRSRVKAVLAVLFPATAAMLLLLAGISSPALGAALGAAALLVSARAPRLSTPRAADVAASIKAPAPRRWLGLFKRRAPDRA